MATLLDERCTYVSETVRKSGKVLVSEIASKFEVSEMTVRRDLDRMEEDGLVRRVRGGAVRSDSAKFSDRLRKSCPDKKKAAMKLAQYLPKSGSIYLDGSTTILNLIDELRDCEGLQVVTNNIEAFQRLQRVPNIDALLIGGRQDPRTDNMIGSLALRGLNSLAFDAAFFSCWGITPNLGPMEVTLEDAEVKELVAQRCGKVYMAVCSSKFGTIVSGTWRTDPAKTTLATELAPEEIDKAYFDMYANTI